MCWLLPTVWNRLGMGFCAGGWSTAKGNQHQMLSATSFTIYPHWLWWLFQLVHHRAVRRPAWDPGEQSSSKVFYPFLIHPFFCSIKFMHAALLQTQQLEGPLVSQSKHKRLGEEKISLWIVVSSIPIVRGLQAPAVLGWWKELRSAQLFSSTRNKSSFVLFSTRRVWTRVCSFLTSPFGVCSKLLLNIHSE